MEPADVRFDPITGEIALDEASLDHFSSNLCVSPAHLRSALCRSRAFPVIARSHRRRSTQSEPASTASPEKTAHAAAAPSFQTPVQKPPIGLPHGGATSLVGN